MPSVMDCLRPHERRQVSELAAQYDEPAETVAACIVSAWLGLANDAPGALPRDPMRGLRIKGGSK